MAIYDSNALFSVTAQFDGGADKHEVRSSALSQVTSRVALQQVQGWKMVLSRGSDFDFGQRTMATPRIRLL